MIFNANTDKQYQKKSPQELFPLLTDEKNLESRESRIIDRAARIARARQIEKELNEKKEAEWKQGLKSNSEQT